MMEEAVQRLLDEAAIKKVHIRYCRAVDRRDWELLRSCYHPDAIDDHGEFEGGYVGGIDGFIEYCIEGTPHFLSTSHFTGNQLVEVDGDRAWAEHYARAYHRIAGKDGEPDRDEVANVRYVDKMERRNGEWRFLHRTVIVDTDRTDPVTKRWAPAALLRGTRDRNDPSYSV
jgi:hypothetical protein